MELADLVRDIQDFDAMPPRRKICLFGWFLHVHRGAEKFDNNAIRRCFRDVGLAVPDVTVYLPRMAGGKPPQLIRNRGTYSLERTVRQSLHARYGIHQSTMTVTKLLADLPAKIPDAAAKVFLVEALNCYKACAYRAAIIMAWNLAFHHLLKWILADPTRVAEFNAAIPKRFPQRTNLSIACLDTFDELKEADIVEICRTAKLFSRNLVDILRDKLKRRNMSAHPSLVTITQHQADDAISDLVHNVVLRLV
jgi:hypothetical protein